MITFGHRKASKILVPQNAGWPPQFVWWKSSCNDSENSYKTRIPARIMNRRILSCKSCCAPMGFWHGSSQNLSLNMPHCSLFLRYLHRISHHLPWCLGAHSSSILSPRNWLTAQQHTCLSCKGQKHPSHMFNCFTHPTCAHFRAISPEICHASWRREKTIPLSFVKTSERLMEPVKSWNKRAVIFWTKWMKFSISINFRAFLIPLHGKSSPFLSKTAGINEIQNISKPTLPNSIKKDGRTKGKCKEQSDGTVMVKSYLGVSSLLQIGPTTATPSTVGPPQTWPSLRLIHSISPCGSCPTKIALLTAGFKIRGYHAKPIHPPCNIQILGVKSPKILFPLLGSNSCNSLRALSMLRAFWLSKSPGRSPVKGVK